MNDHHRRSIRWRDYDYSWPGVYFVTIVVRRRLCLFGDVQNGAFIPNAAGEMVASQWRALATRFAFCEPSTFVVMPNHFHGLLIFKNAPPLRSVADVESDGKSYEHPEGTAHDSLGRVMQAFKSLTTNAYICGVRAENWAAFDRQLWLRNYWERVIRNDEEWLAAHKYIQHNPLRWLDDKHYPDIASSLSP